MEKEWTTNSFWSQKRGNGMYKVQFYTLSTRGNEKTYSIFERDTMESVIILLGWMKNWAKNKKGNYQYCWRIYNDNYECEQCGIY